ncbi:MAG: orotidine-5'-phosphate decarboxylase [Planctomycetota bacterium]|jgi:orotidine-5'-phosphate decarboxylase
MEDSAVIVHPADRLFAAIDRCRAPVCVGLDPVLGKLPAAVRDGAASAPAALEAFSLGVIRAVSPHVPCVKFQSACFERYGADGIAALHTAMAAADELGLESILDAKRGDIGISAEHYAAAAFDGPSPADWITLSGYLGSDTIQPFRRAGHGGFVLVRTSNPGGDELQGLRLEDGRTLDEAVAQMVATLGNDRVGVRGYSDLGAVVGATKPEAARRLRQLMPRQLFLIPGFGAQGGGVDDILPCFDSAGAGGLVTASRSVIYAAPLGASSTAWCDGVAAAAEELAAQVGGALGMR